MQTQIALEQALDAFLPGERRAALTALAESVRCPAPGANVNMHFHSFFSYNAKGWSPSRIAWESRRGGLYAAGLCDFDVLDGLEEFLEAGLTVGLRATVNLETRAYLREYAKAEINSPGEPGVTYIMGGGFTRVPAAGSPPAAMLQQLRDQAAARNRALVTRVNPHVGAAAIDYERDVVPLSPGRCPTERHIVRAYADKARDACGDEAALTTFWAALFGKPADEVRVLLGNRPALEERIRARLVKQGGLGYEPPTEKTFPLVDDFVAWVLACGAIPMVTWLDGTSQGEADAMAMVTCLRAKGAAAANIIPDRNWNYKDPAVRALKTRKLGEFVEACERLDLPVNIGTEMNRDGLPFADDLAGEALAPHKATFTHGAQVMVGHTLLGRYAGFPYTGAAARAEFGDDLKARNRFFAAVGALPPLTCDIAGKLSGAGVTGALAAIRQAVKKGLWQ
jgi:hypothetical protein